MKGVSYLVDDDGKKTAVILSLAQHRRLWEDIHDRMVIESRKHELRETLEQVRNAAVRHRGDAYR